MQAVFSFFFLVLLLVFAACSDPVSAQLDPKDNPDTVGDTRALEQDTPSASTNTDVQNGSAQSDWQTVRAKMELINLDEAEQVQLEGDEVVYRLRVPLRYRPAAGYKPRLAFDGHVERFVGNVTLPGQFAYKNFTYKVDIAIDQNYAVLSFRSTEQAMLKLKDEVMLMFVYHYKQQ